MGDAALGAKSGQLTIVSAPCSKLGMKPTGDSKRTASSNASSAPKGVRTHCEAMPKRAIAGALAAGQPRLQPDPATVRLNQRQPTPR